MKKSRQHTQSYQCYNVGDENLLLGENVMIESTIAQKTPLDIGLWLCKTVMKTPADQLPPVGGFHYHQGVALMGMQKVYQLCEEEEYGNALSAIKNTVSGDMSISSIDEVKSVIEAHRAIGEQNEMSR